MLSARRDISITIGKNRANSKPLLCQQNDKFDGRMEIAASFLRQRLTDHILFSVIVLEWEAFIDFR